FGFGLASAAAAAAAAAALRDCGTFSVGVFSHVAISGAGKSKSVSSSR
ncbi:MAG: hypothetical protein BJ554DRAFT_4449, partial [Olpidium bornovanus]